MLALAAAAAIEEANATGRLHLRGQAQRDLSAALEKLKALAATERAGDDGADWQEKRPAATAAVRGGIPREVWSDPALAFLHICNTGYFLKNAAGEFEPVQRVCTLPRGHEGPHSGNLEEDRAWRN